MDDVGALQLTEELWPIDQLRDGGPHELEIEQPRKCALWNRIDRHEPRLDARIVGPCLEQSVRLNGLPPKNAQRRRHNRDAQLSRKEKTVSL